MARKLKPHIIVEIDGEELSITTAEAARRTFRVLSCKSGPFQQWVPALREHVLESMAEAGIGAASVHVVLGGTGFAAFDLNLPGLGEDELLRVLDREAHSKLSRPAEVPVLIGSSSGARGPGKLRRHSVLALSSESIGFLRDCIDEPLLNVHKIARKDDAFALVLAKDLPECIVSLRPQRGGLRCELIESSTLRSGRLIELGHATPGLVPGEEPTEALLAGLELEIGRTLEYFADLGLPTPEALAVDPALGLTDWLRSQVEGRHEVIDLDLDDRHTGDLEQSVPPATLGLLRHLSGQADLITIELQTPERTLGGPRAAAGAVCALFLVSTFGVVSFGRSHMGLENEIGSIRRRIAESREQEMQLMLLEATGDKDQIVDADLHALIVGRRPASRLVAEISNRVPRGLLLDEVGFTIDDVVKIRGVVRATSRLEALRVLEGFKAELEAVPFLRDVRETVRYDTATGSQGIQFDVDARWRE